MRKRRKKNITEVVQAEILERAKAAHASSNDHAQALKNSVHKSKWWRGSRTNGELISVSMNDEISLELSTLMAEAADITAKLEALKNRNGDSK